MARTMDFIARLLRYRSRSTARSSGDCRRGWARLLVGLTHSWHKDTRNYVSPAIQLLHRVRPNMFWARIVPSWAGAQWATRPVRTTGRTELGPINTIGRLTLRKC